MSERTLETAYVTRPLTADTWDDFAELVEANNGVWGGCWCMWRWVMRRRIRP